MSESENLLVPLRELSAYILEFQSKLKETLELFICSLVIFILLNALLFYLIHRRNGRSKARFCRSTKLPEHVSRVLLVTAHPDDECMFFGPTLIALRKRRNCRVFVLCMSRGELGCHERGSLVAKSMTHFQVILRSKANYAKMSCGIPAAF